MTEESDLQAKIAALSGKIHQHKQHQQSPPSNATYSPAQYSPVAASRGRARWSPYGRGSLPSRGTRGSYRAPYHNRTLHLGGKPTQEANGENARSDGSEPGSAHGTGDFVSARGRGVNQLMSKDTFAREQKQKLEQQGHIQTAKRQEAYNRETAKFLTAVQQEHILTVDGLRYQLRADGGKLFRVAGDAETSGRETPKKVSVAGVNFYRTKKGNLVRAKAVTHLTRPTQQKPRPQCSHFTKNGVCPHGPSCKFTHDPDQVAICKTFLHKGDCPSGEYCDLSHDPTYHRVPACTHFLRGNCTNAACRYPHIHVSPTAPVCKAFATMGYCSNGPSCDERHVVECPAYSNDGFCRDRESGKCQLPHIDRAAALRKAADRQSQSVTADESDTSSDSGGEDAEIEDIDSDEADFILGDGDDSHSMSQQHDFVSLA